MEDVLEVYTRSYDPKRPQVCMDETNKQLLTDFHEPLSKQPGQPVRYDYEYVHEGVANLFMFVVLFPLIRKIQAFNSML